MSSFPALVTMVVCEWVYVISQSCKTVANFESENALAVFRWIMIIKDASCAMAAVPLHALPYTSNEWLQIKLWVHMLETLAANLGRSTFLRRLLRLKVLLFENIILLFWKLA